MTEEKKPPRGRKLGVKVFEDVYMPELKNAFNLQIELMKKKAETKRLSLQDFIKEDLDSDEILERITGLLYEAQKYEQESDRLSKKSEELIERAKALTEVTKIYEYGGYTQSIDDITFKLSSEVTRMIEVALMLQPEWFDLKEMEHWRGHFLSQIRSSVTMEQCTEVIEEARQKVAELTQSGGK